MRWITGKEGERCQIQLEEIEEYFRCETDANRNPQPTTGPSFPISWTGSLSTAANSRPVKYSGDS